VIETKTKKSFTLPRMPATNLCAVQPKYWQYTIKKELQGYCQPAQVDWSEQLILYFLAHTTGLMCSMLLVSLLFNSC